MHSGLKETLHEKDQVSSQTLWPYLAYSLSNILAVFSIEGQIIQDVDHNHVFMIFTN